MNKVDFFEFENKSFEEVEERLSVRFLNISPLAELLENVPHRKVCDMETVCCLAFEDGENRSFLTVTKEMLKKWRVAEDELFRVAVANAAQSDPPTMRPLINVLCGFDADFDELEEEGKGEQFYIASTPDGVLGAKVILYPGFLAKAAEKLGGSFYLIPSSIHEFLLLPDTGDVEAEALTEMIHSINETQVSPEERLSDHPYRYDKDMKTITSEGVEEKALFVCA